MSATFPWLTLTAAVPLVGAVVVGLLPNAKATAARLVALVVSVVTLLVAVGATLNFDRSQAGTYQLVETREWIPQLGVSYSVGVNGLALMLLLMSVALVPVCVVAVWRDYTGSSARQFFGLVLVLESLMVLVFCARDLFLFYLVFEVMLIPVFFLIGRFGGSRRQYAAVKFLIYSLAGGLVMLAAVITLYVQGPGGPQGFLIDNLTGVSFSSPAMERLLFLGFFLAFAIKAPLWPVHTWLPDAGAQAPPAVSVLLVGVLDKVGTFGMITLCLPLFPHASQWAAPGIIALALVSVVYGAIVAIGQTNLLRLITYTSISHFGFIVAGIFAFTTIGQTGSSLYMISHGFSTAAMFLVAGMLGSRRGSVQIDQFGGLQRAVPVLAGLFLLAGLSSLALPGMSSFVAEILVFIGTYQRYPVVAAVATLGLVLAALYILTAYQKMFTGPVQEYSRSWRDATRRELVVLGPLIAVIIALGIYPQPMLDILNSSTEQVLHQMQVSDPAPAVPAAERTQP